MRVSAENAGPIAQLNLSDAQIAHGITPELVSTLMDDLDTCLMSTETYPVWYEDLAIVISEGVIAGVFLYQPNSHEISVLENPAFGMEMPEFVDWVLEDEGGTDPRRALTRSKIAVVIEHRGRFSFTDPEGLTKFVPTVH